MRLWRGMGGGQVRSIRATLRTSAPICTWTQTGAASTPSPSTCSHSASYSSSSVHTSQQVGHPPPPSLTITPSTPSTPPLTTPSLPTSPTGMERIVALADLRRGLLPDGFQTQWPDQTRLIRWLMHPDHARRPTAQVRSSSSVSLHTAKQHTAKQPH